jgi:hypothetical protein
MIEKDVKKIIKEVKYFIENPKNVDGRNNKLCGGDKMKLEKMSTDMAKMSQKAWSKLKVKSVLRK